MDFKIVGTIAGTHGLNGWLSAHIHPHFAKHMAVNGFLFIELKNKTFVPHRIEGLKKENQEFFLLKIKDYDNIDLAKKLSSKNLALPTKMLSEKDALLSDNSLEGFILEDTRSDFKGKIESITETAGQVLAFLLINDQDVIIPLNPDLIRSVDRKKKTLRMEIPEGLLDIYLP